MTIPLTKLLLLGCWSGVLVQLLSASIADHPLAVNPRVKGYVFAVAPQGWGFFTKSPREPAERVYGRDHANGWTLLTIRNASAPNWFGFKKEARIRSMELSYLLRQVPDNAWRSCEGEVLACAARDPSLPVRVRNGSLVVETCEAILVERRPPVPWAWSRSGERVAMPAKFVRLSVFCTRGADAPASPGRPS